MLCLKSRAHCKYLKRESSCQILHFRNGVARAGSKLCGPAIFPSPVRRMTLAWWWSLFVRGAWIPHCACFFPSLVYSVRSCTPWPWRTGLWSFPTRFFSQVPHTFRGCYSYIKWALLQSDVFTDKIFALHIVWTTLTSNTSKNYYFRRGIRKGFTT